jgi:hypothetical protein
MHQLSDAIYRLKIWLLDRIATRDSLKTYEGNGNRTEERGWWLFGRWWISYDK